MTLLSQRHKHLLVLGLVEHVGETALAAVLAIEVSSHEDSSAALLSRALTAQTVDLAIVINLVVLEDSQLNLPVLVLDLLGGGVVLLLPLLSTSPQPEDEVEGGLLLDVVVGESPPVLQLFASKDKPLLVGRDSLLVLDLCLNVLDGVARFHLQGDGLASEGLHEDLHAATEPEDEVESALLLDIVVRESPPVLQLLPGKNQSLLIWGNSLLVLDFSLHVLNRIRGLHLQGDGFASEGLHEDLHPPTEPEDEVESALLLDVVIRKSPPVLQLFASEDKSLLVR